MIRFSKLVAALAAVPVLVAGGYALAGSPGQLAGGDNYMVKNLTQKGSYANTISATCNDEVQYSMQLSNTQFGALNNVTLKATLPSNGGVSTATATTDLGGVSGTSDTVTVNLGSGQTISYVNGSSVLFDDKGNAIKVLSDSVTAGGVNIGTLNGSTTEFVNFKAKVNCPTPPVTPPVVPKAKFACVGLDAVKVDRTRFDFTARATAENTTVKSFGFTAKDSKNKVVDTKTVNTSALSAVYNFNQSTAGTYSVSAVVNTDKGSTQPSAICTKQVTVEAPPTTPTPPAIPSIPVVQGKSTELPNTGPGDIAAIFGSASAFGAVGHYAVRRFRRDS